MFLLVTLPLWDPSPVEVGAVGYLSKPRGHFVTLFNGLAPGTAKYPAIKSLPSIHGYGSTQVETHRQDRRTVTQKGMDAFAGLLTFRTFSYVIVALSAALEVQKTSGQLPFLIIAKKCLDVIHSL